MYNLRTNCSYGVHDGEVSTSDVCGGVTAELDDMHCGILLAAAILNVEEKLNGLARMEKAKAP